MSDNRLNLEQQIAGFKSVKDESLKVIQECDKAIEKLIQLRGRAIRENVIDKLEHRILGSTQSLGSVYINCIPVNQFEHDQLVRIVGIFVTNNLK